jgi:predicted Zn-dependent peptidase
VEQVNAIASETIANGLPAVVVPMPHRPEVAIGIAFPGGARYEGRDEVGAAHLLEHMAFKGTRAHPSARDLNRSAERLGADLNGCTYDDYVELTVSVLAHAALPATELLAGIAGEALLEEAHLETERAVVTQEIADDLEDPGTVADHKVIEALFRGHRLATPTVGHAADVARLTHAALLAFRERQWSPAGGVFVAAGNLADLDATQVEDVLLRVPSRPSPPPPPPIPPFTRRVEVDQRDSEVAHLRLVYDLPDLDLSSARHRAVAEIFCDVLAGPAGSRLSEDLREERGLCYDVESFWWGYRNRVMLSVDCSLMSSAAGEAYRRIDAVVRELSTDGPTEEESQRARAYATRANAVGLTSPAARVSRTIYLMLACGDDHVDAAVHLKALEAVTRQDLAGFGAGVSPDPCVACVGALTEEAFA